MYNSDNSIYTNYIDNFLNNLYNLYYHNINYYLNNYKDSNPLLDLKPYLHLLTFIPNNLEDNPNNQYLNYNYDSYYTVNIPLKVNFNNVCNFYVNYNIINIPKITQSGDIILNGYFRTPIVYLKLAVKKLFFKLGNTSVFQYLIKLDYNFKLYIYVVNNNISIYLNSNKIFGNLFDLYNTIIFKNKYINFKKLNNILYLLNLKKIKKYKIFNDVFIFNKFLYNLYIEIFNISNKLINIKSNKKFVANNDNLVYKFSDSVLDSILKIPNNNISTLLKTIKFITGDIDDTVEKDSINTILFKENLLINPLLHYTNQLNILAYLINKFKINIFGYSNFSDNKFNINSGIRKVHSDYIGLINILNTSDGDTCGLMSVLSNNTILDKCKLKLISYSSDALENFIYLDITSKNLNDIIINNFSHTKKNKIFKVKTVEVLENNEFKIINFNKKLNEKPLHILNVLSITELIIPFLFNNDPCRSLMGSKMHTQALPLLYSNNPYVITNYNNVNNLLSSRVIYSTCNGVIQDVDSSRITISDEKDRLICHYLYPFNVVDYNSILFYKPIVWEGEKVCVGKILAVPNDLKNLEFSVGFNNLVNYSFYEGYEHEDAIIINKELIIEDILTSISFNVYEDSLYLKKFDCLELFVQKFFKNSGKRIIDDEDIDEYYSSTYYKYFLPGDELFFKIKYDLYHYKSTYVERLLKLLFPEKKLLLTRNKSLKIKQGGEGRLVKYEILSNYDLKQSKDFDDDLNISYMVLRFFIAKIDRANIGDKLCGRHGNKGVVSKVSEPIDLPYDFNDSSPYSITSPIGALARINLGQFLEGACGYKSLNYNCRIKAPINLFDSYLYSNLYFNALNNSYDFYKNSCLINSISENYLRDFKTGYKLKNFNLLSMPYYLKLMHTSKSKFNYRTIGRYSTVTQQPVEGRNAKGGQKFGEMEIWALEAHGASYNIQELALLKTNIKLFKKLDTSLTCSESFKVLTLELKNVLININEFNKYKFCNDPKIINCLN